MKLNYRGRGDYHVMKESDVDGNFCMYLSSKFRYGRIYIRELGCDHMKETCTTLLHLERGKRCKCLWRQSINNFVESKVPEERLHGSYVQPKCPVDTWNFSLPHICSGGYPKQDSEPINYKAGWGRGAKARCCPVAQRQIIK